MTATSHDRDDVLEDGDWPTLTHTDRLVVGEDSAVVVAMAIEDLTVLPFTRGAPRLPRRACGRQPSLWSSYAAGSRCP